ncbi:MAG: hypothetical protein PHG35_02155 [Dehalococcoidales bacterium]|nr:hypothetical protein [Dehalococcoidales bacterium]
MEKIREEIRFAWVCRNIELNKIHRIELTDIELITGKYPSWIKPGNDNCEILAKIRPTGDKDKSNTEIWEGDFIRLEDEEGECFLCLVDWAEGDENESILRGWHWTMLKNITEEIYSVDDGRSLFSGWTGEPEIIGNKWMNHYK